MFFKLFLIFTLVPVIELGLLIKIGSHIGVINTIAIVILTALVGSYLVRQEGIAVVFRIRESMQQGVFPADDLMNGALILVAGALLLTPGFFTDAIGMLFLIPVTREYIKKHVKRYIEKKMNSGDIEITLH
jgi:UPF0716 protein FxsA